MLDLDSKVSRLEAERNLLLRALKSAVKIADEAEFVWDTAPASARPGKILMALAGHKPGYRRDIDDIHATIKAVEEGRVAVPDPRSGHCGQFI